MAANTHEKMIAEEEAKRKFKAKWTISDVNKKVKDYMT